jgi:hypothetical protein
VTTAQQQQHQAIQRQKLQQKQDKKVLLSAWKKQPVRSKAAPGTNSLGFYH